jgi:hypothetical protein
MAAYSPEVAWDVLHREAPGLAEHTGRLLFRWFRLAVRMTGSDSDAGGGALTALEWKAPRTARGVDRRVVVNPAQARALLAVVRR